MSGESPDGEKWRARVGVAHERKLRDLRHGAGHATALRAGELPRFPQVREPQRRRESLCRRLVERELHASGRNVHGKDELVDSLRPTDAAHCDEDQDEEDETDDRHDVDDEDVEDQK